MSIIRTTLCLLTRLLCPLLSTLYCRWIGKKNFFFLNCFLLMQRRLPCWDLFLWYTVIVSGPAVQETVGGAGFELGTAASSVWYRPVALTNWATTHPKKFRGFYITSYKKIDFFYRELHSVLLWMSRSQLDVYLHIAWPGGIEVIDK
jgi:hypothetical protein